MKKVFLCLALFLLNATAQAGEDPGWLKKANSIRDYLSAKGISKAMFGKPTAQDQKGALSEAHFALYMLLTQKAFKLGSDWGKACEDINSRLSLDLMKAFKFPKLAYGQKVQGAKTFGFYQKNNTVYSLVVRHYSLYQMDAVDMGNRYIKTLSYLNGAQQKKVLARLKNLLKEDLKNHNKLAQFEIKNGKLLSVRTYQSRPSGRRIARMEKRLDLLYREVKDLRHLLRRERDLNRNIVSELSQKYPLLRQKLKIKNQARKRLDKMIEEAEKRLNGGSKKVVSKEKIKAKTIEDLKRRAMKKLDEMIAKKPGSFKNELQALKKRVAILEHLLLDYLIAQNNKSYPGDSDLKTMALTEVMKNKARSSLDKMIEEADKKAKERSTYRHAWWDNPGMIRIDGYVASAVGSADMQGQRSLAVDKARRMALKGIATALGTKVQGLTTEWVKNAGDALRPESSQSYFYNNTTLQRTFVNHFVRGSVQIKVHWEGKKVYLLMGIRSKGFFKAFCGKIGSDLKTRALTDVMKEKALQKLDDVIRRAEKKAKERSIYRRVGRKVIKTH